MALRHPLQNALAPLLYPLSVLYGTGGRLRRALYERGVLRSCFPPAFCISVGNISWGGTGKTPVTDWLLGLCREKGLRAAVLTRGYRARPPFLPCLVTPESNPEECGDEPLMLARMHPEAVVAVDPVRSRAVRLLAEKASPDIYLLDDGFQHRAVKRDLDLVLLDPDDLGAGGAGPRSNWNRVIPAGTWREPASALRAADAFLVKTTPKDWPGLAERALSLLPERPLFAFRMAAQALRPVGRKAPDPRGENYIFAAGIGDPRQAAATAEDFMGRPPQKTFLFPDHHDFQKEKALLEGPGLPVVCTAKDAVKLEKLGLSVPCFALDAAAEFFAAASSNGRAEPFGDWLCRRYRNFIRTGRRGPNAVS